MLFVSLVFDMIREIELQTTTIKIEEGREENVAGNSVWDAALCLINYLNHNKSEIYHYLLSILLNRPTYN